MKLIGQFKSHAWGLVEVYQATYGENGPLAIVLQSLNGEPLAKLSVNMYKPQCSADSRDLPENCFYMKDWAENVSLAAAAKASDLFKHRPDLPVALSGHVWADAYEVLA